MLDNLKNLRLEAGLSQMRLAAKVGVSLETVRRWEYGLNDPKPENKNKLKKVLENELGRKITS